MNERPEAKKKKPVAAEMPAHTINEGSVAAFIWRRQSPSGFAYYDFSLTRSWQSLSTGNTAYSKNFFSRNQSELVTVIQQASQWIIDHEGRELRPSNIAA